jgi:DNA replication protein DnaC
MDDQRIDFDVMIVGTPFVSDDEIAAYEVSRQRESWRKQLSAANVDGLRDEDRARILADTLEPTKALTTVRQWLGGAMRTINPGVPTLVLCGGMGTGKTVAACWAISRHGGLYATVETYLRDYDRWLRDRSYDDKNSPAMWRYKRAQLVVLDELGTEADAALMTRAFERLIDSRQSRRRELTIIMSNLSRDEVIRRIRGGAYGARTYDRMRRDSRIVEVTGESMRKGTW